MSTLVSDAAAVEFGGKSPWPEDTKLFQPYEVEQILLPDFASCLSVKAFLKMCQLPFQLQLRKNAEYMSPSGKVPFIRAGKIIMSEFEPITAFAGTKGLNLSSHLSNEQRAEMKAYMALVENVLLKAELWICWCDQEVATDVTKLRYGSPFAWPLNRILPYLKQRKVQQMLQHSNWRDKTMAQVCDEVRTCCEALAEKLAEQDYFFGGKPTELDALVFGHLYALISTTLPKAQLAEIVVSFPNLSHYCARIDDDFIKETALLRDQDS